MVCEQWLMVVNWTSNLPITKLNVDLYTDIPFCFFFVCEILPYINKYASHIYTVSLCADHSQDSH